MAEKYPNTEGTGYTLDKCELELNGKLFTAIENISHSQPVEESSKNGATGQPILRSRGALGLGSGSVEWSDIGSAQEFIDSLGDGWQEKTWKATLTYSALGRPTIKRTLISCRCLDAEEDHASGPELLGTVMPFSFMKREMNGKKPFTGQGYT
ncbi:MAG TPA: hypothetical protein VGP93_09935 [Polyangiaceae bacterium]|jgi:hypothetical protein|nr:hypothetical protein [Polyangiaceae bacterium]